MHSVHLVRSSDYCQGQGERMHEILAGNW